MSCGAFMPDSTVRFRLADRLIGMREGGALQEVHRCLGVSDHALSMVCNGLDTDATNLESESGRGGNKVKRERATRQ